MARHPPDGTVVVLVVDSGKPAVRTLGGEQFSRFRRRNWRNGEQSIPHARFDQGKLLLHLRSNREQLLLFNFGHAQLETRKIKFNLPGTLLKAETETAAVRPLRNHRETFDERPVEGSAGNFRSRPVFEIAAITAIEHDLAPIVTMGRFGDVSTADFHGKLQIISGKRAKVHIEKCAVLVVEVPRIPGDPDLNISFPVSSYDARVTGHLPLDIVRVEPQRFHGHHRDGQHCQCDKFGNFQHE